MRIWSERDGRADIVVHGFTLVDNLIYFAAGLVMLAAAIATIGVLS